jgi:hypothetical protein
MNYHLLKYIYLIDLIHFENIGHEVCRMMINLSSKNSCINMHNNRQYLMIWIQMQVIAYQNTSMNTKTTHNVPYTYIQISNKNE